MYGKAEVQVGHHQPDPRVLKTPLVSQLLEQSTVLSKPSVIKLTPPPAPPYAVDDDLPSEREEAELLRGLGDKDAELELAGGNETSNWDGGLGVDDDEHEEAFRAARAGGGRSHSYAGGGSSDEYGRAPQPALCDWSRHCMTECV